MIYKPRRVNRKEEGEQKIGSRAERLFGDDWRSSVLVKTRLPALEFNQGPVSPASREACERSYVADIPREVMEHNVPVENGLGQRLQAGVTINFGRAKGRGRTQWANVG